MHHTFNHDIHNSCARHQTPLYLPMYVIISCYLTQISLSLCMPPDTSEGEITRNITSVQVNVINPQGRVVSRIWTHEEAPVVMDEKKEERETETDRMLAQESEGKDREISLAPSLLPQLHQRDSGSDEGFGDVFEGASVEDKEDHNRKENFLIRAPAEPLEKESLQIKESQVGEVGAEESVRTAVAEVVDAIVQRVMDQAPAAENEQNDGSHTLVAPKDATETCTDEQEKAAQRVEEAHLDHSKHDRESEQAKVRCEEEVKIVPLERGVDMEKAEASDTKFADSSSAKERPLSLFGTLSGDFSGLKLPDSPFSGDFSLAMPEMRMPQVKMPEVQILDGLNASKAAEESQAAIQAAAAKAAEDSQAAMEAAAAMSAKAAEDLTKAVGGMFGWMAFANAPTESSQLCGPPQKGFFSSPRVTFLLFVVGVSEE